MTDKLDHGEGCTCGCQDGNDEDMTITLDFGDDGKVEVEPLLFFDLDGKDYIALVPTDEEAEDVYFFIYHDLDDEEFEFLDIEDDAEFDRVVAEFERLIGETEGSDE
jgi:hypothetical protein